ncbi:hypothetical protein KAZ01_02160 [Candidatus Gracilibacteria bacterium]|nr:hypothetical protein [Candidatus Gracilibacteria bacterium]
MKLCNFKLMFIFFLLLTLLSNCSFEKHTQNDNVKLDYNISEQYANNILNLCKTIIEEYTEIYGLNHKLLLKNEKILVKVILNKKFPLNIQAIHKNELIYFSLNSEKQLLPPPEGPYHIFGFSYTIAALLLPNIDNKIFGEGINGYLATRILKYIHNTLGEKAWTIPYNYLEIEGYNELKNNINNNNMLNWSPEKGTYMAASKICYLIEEKFGAKIFGKIMIKLKEDKLLDSKTFKLEDFKKTLYELTGDKTIFNIFIENGF